MRKLLAKQDLLTEIENDTILCKWIIKYTEAWEREYNKGEQERYNISRKILLVMHNALFEVKELLDISPVTIEELEGAVSRVQ